MPIINTIAAMTLLEADLWPSTSLVITSITKTSMNQYKLARKKPILFNLPLYKPLLLLVTVFRG
jgi:hypothetical protein